jgi:hypothetical protein
MNRNSLSVALIAASLGLAACGDHRGEMVNAKICADFRTVNTAQTGVPAPAVTDAATPVDECVRRWAYSLAGARDTADVVADATVAACAAPLSRWNQAGLAQQAQTGAGGPVEALSLTTGQPTTALAEHSNFAHGRALFYVVQARAGHCAPPPVTNGVPVGT